MSHFKIVALFMIYGFIIRILCFFFNIEDFTSWNLSDLSLSLLVGLRYDLSTTLFILSPIIIFWLFPIKRIVFSDTFLKIRSIYICVSSFLFIAANVIDIELFGFIQRRLTVDVFQNKTDIYSIGIKQFLQFWHLFLIFSILYLVFFYMFRKLNKVSKGMTLKKSGYFARSFFLSLLVVIGMRGGIQARPLEPSHSILGNSTSNFSVLSLNSLFTLIKSSEFSTLKRVQYSPSDLEVKKRLHQLQGNGSNFARNRDNVIVLIMESMGSEYLGPPVNSYSSRLPFLEELGQKGVMFVNNFANGGETGPSHYSVLASLPEFMIRSFLYTPYQNNRIVGLGSILKKYGYRTFFFHGGPKGLFRFDSKAQNLGFDTHYFQEDYPGKNDEMSDWGWHDGPYLNYMAGTLDNVQEPFGAYFLSLSNHPPYILPKNFTAKMDPSWDEKDRGAFYADNSLREFFRRVENYPWYQNTLFVITGDHAPFNQKENYQNSPLGRKRVPLVFFHPRKKFPVSGHSLRITHQLDILPSILDFLGVFSQERSSMTLLGRSVWSNKVPGTAFFFDGRNEFYFVTGNLVTKQLIEEERFISERVGNSFLLNGFNESYFDENESRNIMRDIIQYYSNSLIDNSLYIQ